MQTCRNERLLFIEYHRGKPFSVQTVETRETYTSCLHYDFEWSRRLGTLYYHLSGSVGWHGKVVLHDPCIKIPPTRIWAAHDAILCRLEQVDEKWVHVPLSPVEVRAMGYRRLLKPLLLNRRGKTSRDPFAVGEEAYAHFAYCSLCDDRFPDDLECEHLEWCEECGNLVYIDSRRWEGDDKAMCPHREEE